MLWRGADEIPVARQEDILVVIFVLGADAVKLQSLLFPGVLTCSSMFQLCLYDTIRHT